MRGLLARMRSFWHGLRKPAQVDAEMADEMRFHIDMEAQRLMSSRRGAREHGHGSHKNRRDRADYRRGTDEVGTRDTSGERLTAQNHRTKVNP